MAGFLYFIPGASAGLDAKAIAAARLAGVLCEGPIVQQHTLRGPGGGPGVVAAVSSEPSSVRFAPDRQQWQQAGGYWIGIEEPAPGPEELARKKQLDGHLLELGDGQKWLCPAARFHVLDGGEIRWQRALPRKMQWIDGRWQPGPVVPSCAALWETAAAWWNLRMEVASAQTAAEPWDDDRVHNAAAGCLAANYRLGPAEISRLGLFESDTARDVLDALVDLPTVLALGAELQKKTASPAPASS
jgi:hypothetical protein